MLRFYFYTNEFSNFQQKFQIRIYGIYVFYNKLRLDDQGSIPDRGRGFFF
jgi:hypothetical protein